MRYKNYINKISENLMQYKVAVDLLEKAYQTRKKEIENEANEKRGKWTEEYIKEYLEKNDIDSDYKSKLSSLRAKTEPTVIHYLERIETMLNNYFNAPIKSDFANKITSIKISGLQLTDLEFQILKDSASSYMECRLLNQLAESRVKSKEIVRLDDKGTPKRDVIDVTDAYLGLELPDIENVYSEYNNYKRATRGLLYSYSGKDAHMAHLLDGDIPNYISITMDSYFRNKVADQFVSVLDKANSILPDSKIKRELTDNDRKFIDTLVDVNYPSLAKDKVKKLAESDGYIENLLLLDERYNKYLED